MDIFAKAVRWDQAPWSAWSTWIRPDDVPHLKMLAEPGSAFCIAVSVGTLGRLGPHTEHDDLSDLRRPRPAHPLPLALSAWLSQRGPSFWAAAAREAPLAIEALEARLETLDARYQPDDATWRALFLQALHQREALAALAWATVSGGATLSWRDQLRAVDELGQSLLDGALDLRPVEDDRLARLAGMPGWWLHPDLVTE